VLAGPLLSMDVDFFLSLCDAAVEDEAALPSSVSVRGFLPFFSDSLEDYGHAFCTPAPGLSSFFSGRGLHKPLLS